MATATADLKRKTAEPGKAATAGPLYAESFRDETNLRRAIDDAQMIVSGALAGSTSVPSRHIRIDHARRKKTQKRGGNETRRARRGGRSESRRRTLGPRRSTDPIGGPGRAKSATGGERLAHRRLGSVTAVGGW